MLPCRILRYQHRHLSHNAFRLDFIAIVPYLTQMWQKLIKMDLKSLFDPAPFLFGK